MTELVIRTIHRNTDREDFRLVVLDNGSDGETPDKLRQMQDNGLIDELFLIKTNLGLEAARNFLLNNATTTDYFVDIDNDCLPPKDWLPRQLDLMYMYESYAAISQRTQVMIGTGNIFEAADEHSDDLVDFPHPGGSFRLMDTKAVFRVGGWDREATGRGAEERYICGKLRDAGYKTAFAPKIQCLHLFGTRGSNPTDRWGYDKEWSPEQTGHSDIWHPVLGSGDDYDAVKNYTGEKYADMYFAA